jgi:hypothetical protein
MRRNQGFNCFVFHVGKTWSLAEAPLRNKSAKKGVLNYESTNESESTHKYNG